MERIRSAAVAGSFYPSDARDLARALDECFANSLGPDPSTNRDLSLIGGLVPHAGYTYSGPCAAHLYARLQPQIKRVILLGVNHRGRGKRAALSASQYWETPVGRVRVDTGTNKTLEEKLAFLTADDTAHRSEHSIEVQLPFLQRILGDFSFVPIALSETSLNECKQLADALVECYLSAPEQTMLLASSDLSHYLSPEETQRLDTMALGPVLGVQPVELMSIVEKEDITMCGVLPTVVLLFAIERLGVREGRLLAHYHSGDVTPMSEVVGYASVAFQP